MNTVIQNLLGGLWAIGCISLIPLVAWLHWPTFVVGCCVYIVCCFAAVAWEVAQWEGL